ncbi:possible outer membrane protein [Nitrobacter winogradskyi Nb-255]|uniref:Possible outer membrane protein n=1 Tax=Nitrobacter winogradskyi (strain ATCC 25391 / DSM 10237 / CIP 104748 / NCIMB 11846 / Nb-255) TaxID=323098 RepID=Q3SUP2_NITWN|nr:MULTISPECIES: outer membrane protein [Nitrobacter]ABA03999.1 possible outer membrane protein [Nitrobacter winogradskyi Nb-255]MCB1392912.1 porin family protein [Nitrobacter sp.]
MKKILLITAAVLVSVPAASAADLAPRPYTKAPPYVPAPIYNWTGFYLGGHIGGAFSNGRDGVFLGGVQSGWDLQFAPNWVFGLEGSYSFLDSGIAGANLGLGSATARLGYTWGGPALFYVKGGYGTAVLRGNNAIFGINPNIGLDGYTVGAGLEYMFTQNWAGKVEYQYFDFGRIAGTNINLDTHTVKVGLNYRFNLGAPAAAPYAPGY